MFKQCLRGFMLVVLMVIAYGCAAPKMQVRGYIEDRPRVDQGPDGNSGFIAGTPKTEDKVAAKTRKIYVVELSKEADESTTKNITIEESPSASSLDEPIRITKEAARTTPKVSIPSFDDTKTVSLTGETTYTIEKDDTLQKIAKKFYGSYNKWPKIYEANKTILKDPNHVKPGLVIKIPQ